MTLYVTFSALGLLICSCLLVSLGLSLKFSDAQTQKEYFPLPEEDSVLMRQSPVPG